jgi:hypothetical protein
MVLSILATSLFLSAVVLMFFSLRGGSGEAGNTAIGNISENELIAGLSAAAIGSLLTALVVFIIEDNRDKRQAAVAVLEEFTSYDFLETRNRAGLVLKEHLHEPLKGLDDLYFALRNGNWRYVSHIEHFFKKVDRLIALGEVDRKYINSFLASEFPHWYNKYFFPMCLADIARANAQKARDKDIEPARILTNYNVEREAQGGIVVSLPLAEVDYVSAYGADRTRAEKQNNLQEVLEMIEHVEKLSSAGVLEKDKFKRRWPQMGLIGPDQGDFLNLYEGEALPFPMLRALTRSKGK